MTPTAIFPAAARTAFAALYPAQAGKLSHALTDHPLLTLDALAALAEALPADSVEWNPGDLPIGIDPADVPKPCRGVGETIRAIDSAASWVVLKRIEQVPAYAALLRAAPRWASFRTSSSRAPGGCTSSKRLCSSARPDR